MITNDKELPEGWVLSDIGSATFLSKDKINPPFSDSTKYLSLEHIESNTSKITGYGKASAVKSTKAVFHAGDILYGKLRPYLNKVCIPSFDGICSTDILIFLNTPFVDNTFVHNYLKSYEVVNYANQNMSGVQLPRISYEKLSKYPFPLAPLPEQKRIAAKLDNLLSRVSNVGQRLERTKDLVKKIRQSVLSAAISGKLTEDWRVKNDNEKYIWLDSTVKEVTDKIQYGYTASSQKDAVGPKLLRITDIQNGKVDWDNVPYCKIGKHKKQNYLLTSGDIVFARTGATTGKSYLIKKCSYETVFASYLIRVCANKSKMLPEYLFIFFQSNDYWQQISENISGSAQPNCNASKLSQLTLLLPPIKEQKEITRRVEALFSLADKIEARIKAVQTRTDKLPQSILNKAFTGQLVPTEAELARIEGRTYETAEQLLERIQAEIQSHSSKNKNKNKTSTKKSVVKPANAVIKSKTTTQYTTTHKNVNVKPKVSSTSPSNEELNSFKNKYAVNEHLSGNALTLLYFLITDFDKSEFTMEDVSPYFSLMGYEDLKEAMFDLLDENVTKTKKSILSMTENSDGKIVFIFKKGKKE